MHKPTKLAYRTGTEGHRNSHAYVQIGISPSCRWEPFFRAIGLTLHLWVLRIVLESVVEALDCSCWSSAENWCSWLLRGVKLSPLKTKHKITNRAQLSTAKSVREGAPGELVCLSSLGAFWKTHTFIFHPHAKSRNISRVLFTQEERTISINGCI